MVSNKILSLMCKVLDRRLQKGTPWQYMYVLISGRDGSSPVELGTLTINCSVELRTRKHLFQLGDKFSMIYLDLTGSRYKTSLKPSNAMTRSYLINSLDFDLLVDDELCTNVNKLIGGQDVVRRGFRNPFPVEFSSYEDNRKLLPVAFLKNDATQINVTGKGDVSVGSLDKLTLGTPVFHSSKQKYNYLDMSSFRAVREFNSESFAVIPMAFLDYDHEYILDFKEAKKRLGWK